MVPATNICRDPAPFEDMVWIPGGTFLMGSNSHYPEEAPAHRYRPAARMAQSIGTSTCQLGFRCIVRVAKQS